MTFDVSLLTGDVEVKYRFEGTSLAILDFICKTPSPSVAMLQAQNTWKD